MQPWTLERVDKRLNELVLMRVQGTVDPQVVAREIDRLLDLRNSIRGGGDK